LSKEEAELINRCKQGDIKSYELLYNRYSRAMYHTCLRMVVNEADAEDILQDAFMEAFTNLGRLKNIDAFAGWLKRTVINKALNQLKKKRKTWPETDDAELDNLPEEDTTDENDFREKVDAITAALNLLPDKYRVVINLHVFENLSFEEIADVLEIPSSTIRSQYLRSRQKILNSIAHKI